MYRYSTRMAALMTALALVLVGCSEWSPPSSDPLIVRCSCPGFGDAAPSLLRWKRISEEYGDVVARVRITSIEKLVLTIAREEYNERIAIWREVTPDQHSIGGTGDVFVPTIAYRFDVMEYLKGGDGSSEIWGLVWLEDGESNTRREADAAYAFYSNLRDTQYDDREGIVVLVRRVSIQYAERLLFLWLVLCVRKLVESQSLRGKGGWYPSTSPPGGAPTAPEEQTFMTEPAHWPGPSERKSIDLPEVQMLASLTDEQFEARHEQRVFDVTAEALTPQKLTAIIVAEDSVTLRWNGIKDGAAETYSVLRKEEGESEFRKLADITGSDDEVDVRREYEDRFLAAGTTYTYTVRGVYGKYHSGENAQVTITTKARPTPVPEPEPTATPVAPGIVVQNLTASATHNSVTLNWEPPTDTSDLTGYRIMRRAQDDSSFTHLADIQADATTYTDTADIEPATQYIYRVRAQADVPVRLVARVTVTTEEAPAP